MVLELAGGFGHRGISASLPGRRIHLLFEGVNLVDRVIASRQFVARGKQEIQLLAIRLVGGLRARIGLEFKGLRLIAPRKRIFTLYRNACGPRKLPSAQKKVPPSILMCVGIQHVPDEAIEPRFGGHRGRLSAGGAIAATALGSPFAARIARKGLNRFASDIQKFDGHGLGRRLRQVVVHHNSAFATATAAADAIGGARLEQMQRRHRRHRRSSAQAL